MKQILKNISSIRTGCFAKPSGEGVLVYLQSKHFDENGQLNAVLYPDLSADGVSSKHLLQEGDVLFAAKGSKNFAAVFENHNEPSVASTSFFVIRVHDGSVLPQFLSWTLNSQEVQGILKGQAMGTSMPSISKQVLENIEVSIPDLETQNAIVQITTLRYKELALKREIENLREKQLQKQITNALK